MARRNPPPRQRTRFPEEPERPEAVALRYRPDRDRAPRVTAKGSGTMAERILEVARRHEIPIREDKNLIQVLSQLDPDQEIPPELYFVVAEILAFVYRSARAYRREMAESYRRLGDRRFDDGDLDGARRSWQTADSIMQALNLTPTDSAEDSLPPR
jgi:flagellar biosynthesis protein